ncbi:MAG: GNAT family N-acetyltransferase [Candidatus Methanospirareceae archaeon]
MKPVIKDFNCFAVAELYALYRDVYASSEGMSETLEDKYPCLDDFTADVVALERLPGAIALAVEIAGRPVAYLIIRPRRQARLRHTADLNMGVAQAVRGQGLGRLILQAALERASASAELEILYLMVRADNEPAIRLYKKMGFEEVAILSRDTKIGDAYFDGLLMRTFVAR